MALEAGAPLVSCQNRFLIKRADRHVAPYTLSKIAVRYGFYFEVSFKRALMQKIQDCAIASPSTMKADKAHRDAWYLCTLGFVGLIPAVTPPTMQQLWCCVAASTHSHRRRLGGDMIPLMQSVQKPASSELRHCRDNERNMEIPEPSAIMQTSGGAPIRQHSLACDSRQTVLRLPAASSVDLAGAGRASPSPRCGLLSS